MEEEKKGEKYMIVYVTYDIVYVTYDIVYVTYDKPLCLILNRHRIHKHMFDQMLVQNLGTTDTTLLYRIVCRCNFCIIIQKVD